MTQELFREDSYLKTCTANVTESTGNLVRTDQTVFYPLGGGQPGDTGEISWGGGRAMVIDTRYVDGDIAHVLEESAALPQPGDQVELSIDWDRRYRHCLLYTSDAADELT